MIKGDLFVLKKYVNAKQLFPTWKINYFDAGTLFAFHSTNGRTITMTSAGNNAECNHISIAADSFSDYFIPYERKTTGYSDVLRKDEYEDYTYTDRIFIKEALRKQVAKNPVIDSGRKYCAACMHEIDSEGTYCGYCGQKYIRGDNYESLWERQQTGAE